MNVVYDKTDQRVPIKIWSQLDSVEPDALKQLKNMSLMPFVFKHVCAMPDVHLGIGATVGSVVATKGAVIPSAVGVDIGCGMAAMQLNIPAQWLREKASEIRSAIEECVPVGFSENKEIADAVTHWDGWKMWANLHAPSLIKRGEKAVLVKAINQLCSLGGGNHFIELCEDTKGGAWIMLHSGSRGVGNMIAKIHIDHAKTEMKRMFIELPDPDLAYFVEQSLDYDYYIRDLMWCQSYAAENRNIMADRILHKISSIMKLDQSCVVKQSINCHHNYAAKENHYGENVLVTRKGAVRAREGELGIIPGSMGTRSYIVRGLGNATSFHSCSHGAGRRMSRTEARRRYTIDDLVSQTAGVNCRKDEGVLDEIPGAYKDIDVVMDNQKDLVEIVAELKQFVCIKG